MLRKLIGKIRRQPKRTRENISLGIAATFTLAVATVWLVNVPGTFNSMMNVNGSSKDSPEDFFNKVSSQTAAVKEALTPKDSTKESLKDLIEVYKADDSVASSTRSEQSSTASSSASSTRRFPAESAESFTSDTPYETEEPQEVRIQAVTKSTTSTATSE